MVRQARFSLAGLPHCVAWLAHSQSSIFQDDEDRQRFLLDLLEASREHGVAVHAFSLQPHRVDVMCTPPTETAISGMVQAVGRRYVGWFNQRHLRSGTLWAGRYRSCAVEADGFSLSALQWVDSAGGALMLVSDLLIWPWTSAAHHLGHRRLQWLVDPPCYWQLGNTPFERELAYRAQLTDNLPRADWPTLAQCLRSGRPFGSVGFYEDLALRHPGFEASPRARGRPRKVFD